MRGVMSKGLMRSAGYEYAKTAAYSNPNKHWHASNKAETGLGAAALIGLLIPVILFVLILSAL